MEKYLKQLNEIIVKEPIKSYLITFLAGLFIGGLTVYLFSFSKCTSKELITIDSKEEIVGKEIAESSIKSVEVKGISEGNKIEYGELTKEDVKHCVDIAGAVKNPGVYCLAEGSRLVDILGKAGGFISEKYTGSYVSREINFSMRIQDEQKIYIPYKEDTECKLLELSYVDEVEDDEQNVEKENAEIENNNEESNCININTATMEQLTTISGVGESTAQKIIDARPFGSNEDLLDVSGIGDTKYSTILPYLCEL